ncbi:hypothetical protein BN129_986 [Cronobacter sakazakii 701]|nr:hypothetical protein BN129_986 [Cronobacter sakazakii 701]
MQYFRQEKAEIRASAEEEKRAAEAKGEGLWHLGLTNLC